MDRKSPLVSVIVPCYNSAGWLASCLESITSQTWTNLEIIVVDDGSTDGSAQIIKGCSDKRLRYVFQENKGACAARNLGLSKATGDYVQFFDSDDILHTDKIYRQLEVLARNPGKLASSSWLPFRHVPGDMQVADAPIFRNLIPKEYFEFFLNGQGDIPLQAWLLPRCTIERAGLWDESLLISQDGEYLARLIAASEGSVHVGGFVGFYYRRQWESISKLNSKEKLRSAITAMDKIAVIAAECGVEVRSTQLADYYYRLMTNSYPLSRSLFPELCARIEKYGGGTCGARLGGRTINFVAKIVGWKAARILQLQYQRYRRGRNQGRADPSEWS